MTKQTITIEEVSKEAIDYLPRFLLDSVENAQPITLHMENGMIFHSVVATIVYPENGNLFYLKFVHKDEETFDLREHLVPNYSVAFYSKDADQEPVEFFKS